MMLKWTPTAVRFMRDASEYHRDYYRHLCARVLTHLPDRAHVCDAGCGTGYLSLELATFCRQVTAVDLSASALRLLEENLQSRHIGNVAVRCGDINELAPQKKYSGMAFCYFGRTPQIIRIAKAQCNGRIVMVTRNYTHHRFSLQQVPFDRDTVPSCREFLEREQIPYYWENCTIEFGQPFRSLADAVTFFELYNPVQDKEITTQELLPRLVQTGIEEFPWVLPEQKKMGIVAVDTAQIPDRFGELSC